jgi:hypothetical protein
MEKNVLAKSSELHDALTRQDETAAELLQNPLKLPPKPLMAEVMHPLAQAGMPSARTAETREAAAAATWDVFILFAGEEKAGLGFSSLCIHWERPALCLLCVTAINWWW